MNKYRIFMGASVAIAGAAVIGGALVSSSAMADAPADDLTSVTMLQVGSSGDGFQCTFDGGEVADWLQAIPVDAALTTGDAAVAAAPVAGEGVIDLTGASGTGAGGTVVSGTVVSGTVVSGTVVSGTISPGAVPVDELPEITESAVMIPADELRDGTPEECAAVLAEAPVGGDLGAAESEPTDG